MEIVDPFSPEQPFCFKPAPYPMSIQGSFGQVINDQILVCGGYSEQSGEASSKCFSYDVINDEWIEESFSMIQNRMDPGAVLLDDGGWWFSLV